MIDRYLRYFILVLTLILSSCTTTSSRDHVSPSKDPPVPDAPVPDTVFYQKGIASWYGARFQGRPTASGEPFDMNKMTAAHKKLPFGTIVWVKSLTTGKQVRVRINDRGPFVKNRVIDLSKKAARELGIINKGHDDVSVYIEQERRPAGD